MKTIKQPCTLFPPVGWWMAMRAYDQVEFLKNEKWQKQSFRNRIEIAGANGRLMLSLPTVKKSRTQIDQVIISHSENWQLIWWRSLCAAYNNSPYFEYYKSGVEQLLFEESKNAESLFHFNYMCMLWVNSKIDMLNNITHTAVPENRSIEILSQKTLEYYQVFQTNNGFLNQLSILDLLFNLGPETSTFYDS